MIIDNHVHVGWFTDGYHAPRDVWYSALAAGVDGMAVASTSTCAELYKDVCRELRELIRLGGECIFPILWLTPRMLKVRYALPYMLHSKIKWCGIKLHFCAHPEWAHNAKLLQKAIDVAQRLHLPVLLHTGNEENCCAGQFRELIYQNPMVTFVLAHGRPIDEAIEIMRECRNVYVDTAFMPMQDLARLNKEGMSDKVLFGTDAPINELFYKHISTKEFIKGMIESSRTALGQNADEVFGRTVYR